jgi:hypothetical protein
MQKVIQHESKTNNQKDSCSTYSQYLLHSLIKQQGGEQDTTAYHNKTDN